VPPVETCNKQIASDTSRAVRVLVRRREPCVAEVFPDAEAVNEALRFLIRVTKENQR